MSLLSLLHDQHLPFDEKHPARVPWYADAEGRYFRLLRLPAAIPALEGIGGVYLLWHRGVQPRWIYVGHAANLAAALASARDSSDIVTYEADGGLYVTWATIRGEYQSGVVNFLKDTLKPLIGDDLDGGLDAEADPIPVVPPG